MGKTVRIFALCLALLLLLAGCGAQPPSVSGLPGPGTETVSASAAPEARYVYEEVELPEDVFISTAAELADGSLRFISAVSRFLEGEDGGSAFVSESSLWALSSSGEAEKLAVLSDAASEERLSGFMLAPDGSFFCTAYERDTAAELLLRFGPDGSEAGRWRMSELIPEGEYRGLMAVDSAGRLCVSTNVPEADCRLHVFDFSGAEPEEVCDMPLPGLPAYGVSLVPLTDSLVLFWYDEQGGVYFARADTETGALGEAVGITADCSYGLLPGPEGRLFACGVFSLRELDPDTGAGKKLVDYLDYGGSDPPELALSDGRFLVSDGGKGCALAEKVEGSEPLTVLTLALTGQGEDMGAFYLYSLAAKFNRENPDARAELLDYSVYNTAEDSLAGTVRLAADMLSGKCPDILMLEGINSDSWARRGLLLELNAFIDGEDGVDRALLFDNWLRASELDGGLYSIPMSWKVWAAAAAAAYASGREGMSYADVDAILAANPQIEYAVGLNTSRQAYLETALGFNAACLIDREAGKCDFTSGLFEDILAQAAKQPAEAVTGEGTPYGYEWDYNEQAMLASGRQLLYTGVVNLYVLRTFTDALGEDFVFCGFPGGGRGVAAEPILPLGISAATEHPDECWSFLKAVLTKESKTLDNYSALRSCASAEIEQYLENLAGWRENGYDLTADMEAVTARGLALFDEADTLYGLDAEALAIIEDAAAPFFAGEKSAADAAAEVQSRVSTYLAEQG